MSTGEQENSPQVHKKFDTPGGWGAPAEFPSQPVHESARGELRVAGLTRLNDTKVDRLFFPTNYGRIGCGTVRFGSFYVWRL